MREQRTFQAIVELLNDGRWHPSQDLAAVAAFPDEWLRELSAEGVLDVSEPAPDGTLVRLRSSSGHKRLS
jgi:hypothetical protein